MNEKLLYLLLNKVLYAFKFHNTEEHNEYTEIVYSPLYKEAFENVRKRYFEILESEKKVIVSTTHPLEKDSEEYFRVIELIKSFGPTKQLSEESKNELITTIVYPYTLDKELEEYFYSLLNN